MTEQTTTTTGAAQAAGAAPEAKPEDATGKTKDGGQAAEAARAFSQAEVDQIVKDRLARAKEQAARDQEKARGEAEQKTLAEQGEFKKLYEQTQARVAELEQTAAGLETAKEQTKKLEKALAGYRDAQFGGVPEHVQVLLKKLSVVEQLEWLTANGAKLATAAAEKPNGGTPRQNPPRRGAAGKDGATVTPMKVSL